MVKNILIISSDFTGHGHRSITESLCEYFPESDDFKFYIVDGFSLGGSALMKIGKSYGPITRNAKDLWKLIWDISSSKPSLINEFIEFSIKDTFLQLIEIVQPNLILSVHPNFNGSILNILEENQINIPVATLIADLISISPLWSDPRVASIISPTEEAKNKCIEFGVSEAKIKVLGFPVRSRFNDNDKNHEEVISLNEDKPLECLLMSGGEGVGNLKKIAKILLENFNCNVKIIAGRNLALKKRLEKSLVEKYRQRVEIYGFMENIQDLMLASDIAFTRGSPNVMMEAVSCNLPLVIVGALPGQEEGNLEYAKKYNLGVVCDDLKDIKNIISDLLQNNGEKLKQIKDSQKKHKNPDISKNIVEFILNMLQNSTSTNPSINLSMSNKKATWSNHLEKTNIIKISNINYK